MKLSLSQKISLLIAILVRYVAVVLAFTFLLNSTPSDKMLSSGLYSFLLGSTLSQILRNLPFLFGSRHSNFLDEIQS
jgi:hypothetical protein